MCGPTALHIRGVNMGVDTVVYGYQNMKKGDIIGLMYGPSALNKKTFAINSSGKWLFHAFQKSLVIFALSLSTGHKLKMDFGESPEKVRFTPAVNILFSESEWNFIQGQQVRGRVKNFQSIVLSLNPPYHLEISKRG